MDGYQCEMDSKDKFIFAESEIGFVFVGKSLWVGLTDGRKEFFEGVHDPVFFSRILMSLTMLVIKFDPVCFKFSVF